MDLDDAVYLGRHRRTRYPKAYGKHMKAGFRKEFNKDFRFKRRGRFDGLGAIPDSAFFLQAGQLYTFIIGLSSKPSTGTVISFINSTPLTQFFDVVNLTSTLGSSTYNMSVRMKKTVTYSALVNLLRLQLDQWGFSEVDFSGGAAQAPSIFQEVTGAVSAPLTKVSDIATGLTSNIKWIAIAGAAIIGIWTIMPLVRGAGKRK